MPQQSRQSIVYPTKNRDFFAE